VYADLRLLFCAVNSGLRAVALAASATVKAQAAVAKDSTVPMLPSSLPSSSSSNSQAASVQASDADDPGASMTLAQRMAAFGCVHSPTASPKSSFSFAAPHPALQQLQQADAGPPSCGLLTVQ
jgi:hypothetical protein